MAVAKLSKHDHKIAVEKLSKLRSSECTCGKGNFALLDEISYAPVLANTPQSTQLLMLTAVCDHCGLINFYHFDIFGIDLPSPGDS